MVRTYPGRIIKPRVGNRGYLYVNLSLGGKKKSYKVHRLVAIEFVVGYGDDLTVNHIDGDKLNNNDWNLEWITAIENLKHSRDTGLKPKNAFGRTSPNCKGFIEVILNGTVVSKVAGTREILALGFNPSSVSAVVLGRSSIHRGYTFRRVYD